jgi:hypothetical protein
MNTKLLDIAKRDLFLEELESRHKKIVDLMKGSEQASCEWGLKEVSINLAQLKLAIGDMRSLLNELNKLR